MKKWNLVIDIAKCEDCNNCFLACKDEFVDNDFLPYSISQPRHQHRWINILTKERGQCPMVDVAHLPVSCMHCDNPSCIENARDGAVYKTGSGIVIIDPVKAKGQKDLVKSCPYGAIWWNEEQNVAQKCTMCAHLLAEGWKEPRCVQACPTGARRFIKADDDEIEQIIEKENLKVFHPEYQTQPRVYYKNLDRYTKCFIGGTVALEKHGITDCVEGAAVYLFKDSAKIAETVTDNYGDFKFDRLDENSGEYAVRIVYQEYPHKNLEVDLETSINIGTVLFRNIELIMEQNGADYGASLAEAGIDNLVTDNL
jgi:Fe-S-cluster-containing dehydrogenase component